MNIQPAPAVKQIRPLVSVSIITYQHAGFIRQCLDSVLVQETTFPFEILLGEDDSTDGTREICQEYAEKHPDIISLFLHDRKDNLVINGRATGRRNLVNNLQNAKGKYVAWLDGDDYWVDTNKLQIQFDLLEADLEACGSFHDWYVFDQSTGSRRVAIGERKIKRTVDLESLLLEKNISSGSMFFRNVVDWTALPDWFFRVVQGDFATAVLVAQYGPWLYVEQAMVVHRVHSGGIWTGAGLPSANQAEKVRFFSLLAAEPDFEAFRATVLCCRRMESRRWAAAEAREGRLASSIQGFMKSIGVHDRKVSRYMSPMRYLWALVSPVRDFLGQRF